MYSNTVSKIMAQIQFKDYLLVKELFSFLHMAGNF